MFKWIMTQEENMVHAYYVYTLLRNENRLCLIITGKKIATMTDNLDESFYIANLRCLLRALQKNSIVAEQSCAPHELYNLIESWPNLGVPSNFLYASFCLNKISCSVSAAENNFLSSPINAQICQNK